MERILDPVFSIIVRIESFRSLFADKSYIIDPSFKCFTKNISAFPSYSPTWIIPLIAEELDLLGWILVYKLINSTESEYCTKIVLPCNRLFSTAWSIVQMYELMMGFLANGCKNGFADLLMKTIYLFISVYGDNKTWLSRYPYESRVKKYKC